MDVNTFIKTIQEHLDEGASSIGSKEVDNERDAKGFQTKSNSK